MDVLPRDGTVAIDEFVRARAETIRYHETLYRRTSLGTGGSWLAHPHPLVMDSLGLVTRPVHAYDLGTGVGRHTLPIVAGLPTGSRVTERCRAATTPGGVNVIGIVADREEVSSSGARRAALIELPLSGEQAPSVPSPVFHRLGDPCRRDDPSRHY